MKKTLLFFMSLVLMTVVSFAFAETIVDEADRHIQPVDLQADGTFAVNPVIEGESSTTGLPWTGRYQPILVQVDNSTGGVDSVEHWGIRYADVVYETLLHSNGTTRLSVLFSDQMPDAVGPVRSARVAHVWLRQEWQAGFCFYGCQEMPNTNVRKEFIALGVLSDQRILFDGSAGTTKVWKKYYQRIERLASPHNAEVNVAAIQNLVDPTLYQATERPFLFTDTKPTTGEFADFIWIENARRQSVSPSYVYNVDENTYYRYVGGLPYCDKELGEEGHQSYANVIVQRCDTDFSNGGSAPITPVALHNGVASGNAEIFTGGRYIAGYWMRTGMNERTVFLDADGKEIQLQRGKTFIQIVNNSAEVTYSCDKEVMDKLLAEAQDVIAQERAEGVEDTDDLLDVTNDENEPEQNEQVGESKSFETSLKGKATTSVKIRKGPSTNDKVAGTLKKGAKVQIIGETGDWYKVMFQKNECYVMKQYIEIEQ